MKNLNTKTVRLFVDEWYPVYSVEDELGSTEIKVTKKTLLRWNKSLKAFMKTQREMRTLYKQSTQVSENS